MPIFVRTDIYEPVCNQLLENTGLSTLGLMTDANFLGILNDTVSDFLTYTRFKFKINTVPCLAFQSSYTEPDFILNSKSVLYGSKNLYRSYEFYTDAARPNSANDKPGIPRDWYDDDASVKGFNLRPAPAFNGGQVIVALGQGIYGNISQTSDVNDFDITCDPLFANGLLGTVSDCHGGDCYVEVAGPMFGTIANMVASNGKNGNITMIGPSNLFNRVQDLDTYLELISPSFAIYLRYGVLMRIFSGDSEYKDETRTKYCLTRFLEGINLCRAMMGDPSIQGINRR